MTDTPRPAYSRRKWFLAVNLTAVLGAFGFLVPTFLQQPVAAVSAFPLVMIVAFLIAWVLIAYPLSIAMKRPATWQRAALWGGGSAGAIAFVGFVFAHLGRVRSRLDSNFHSQIGGGDYVRSVDGVLTPYGWWVVIQNNALFIMLGISIALVLRAVFGPGRAAE